MSVETKVLSASTRTNLEALNHHMKKLGFKYYKEMNGWVTFGARLMMNGKGVAPSDRRWLLPRLPEGRRETFTGW